MKELGEGLAWMGFWIGLGLYNFQGCTPQVREGVQIYRDSKKIDKTGRASLGTFRVVTTHD